MPVSSALTKASCIRKSREERRRAVVKQMLILADLVERRALAGRRKTRVRRSPTVESPSRT